MINLTTEQINEFRAQAAIAGDYLIVICCDIALDDHEHLFKDVEIAVNNGVNVNYILMSTRDQARFTVSQLLEIKQKTNSNQYLNGNDNEK